MCKAREFLHAWADTNELGRQYLVGYRKEACEAAFLKAKLCLETLAVAIGFDIHWSPL